MRKLIPLLILGIAFGIIEATVVVYMRPLMNPGHGDLALRIVPLSAMTDFQTFILKTELIREIATLVLLASAAAVAATSFLSWGCYFVFTFAAWDLSYYFWLKLRIGWPASVFDWDVLFLVPRMWLAPVIVPVIISCIGIAISCILLRAVDRFGRPDIRFYHSIPIAFALLFWLLSFINKSTPGIKAFPMAYSWWLFFLGLAAAVAALVFLYIDLILRRKHMIFKTYK